MTSSTLTRRFQVIDRLNYSKYDQDCLMVKFSNDKKMLRKEVHILEQIQKTQHSKVHLFPKVYAIGLLDQKSRQSWEINDKNDLEKQDTN